MRPTILVLISAAICCTTTRTVDVLEPLPRTPPQPGYPLSAIVPYWHRPAFLCIVDSELPPPVYVNGTWRCPDPVRP